jgi:L-rhamnose mutarotase
MPQPTGALDGQGDRPGWRLCDRDVDLHDETATKANVSRKVAVVGLATPNAMKPDVNVDCAKSVVLWNPIDLGCGAVYVILEVADGKLKPGGRVPGAKLGKFEILAREILARPSPVAGWRGRVKVRAMQRYAFKMFLNPGQADEYRRRHDAIWPELKTLLRQQGVRNYSIHLDAEAGTLFAYLERVNDHTMNELPLHPVMRRWWDFMKDIMAANPDGSPVAIELNEVFHLE